MGQHVPVEVELREIDLAVDRLQQRGGPDETVVPTPVHGIETVGHVLRPHDLNHRHICLRGGLRDERVVGKSVDPRVGKAEVHTGLADLGLDPRGKRLFNEFAIGLRPAEKGDIGRLQPAARAAKHQL